MTLPYEHVPTAGPFANSLPERSCNVTMDKGLRNWTEIDGIVITMLHKTTSEHHQIEEREREMYVYMYIYIYKLDMHMVCIYIDMVCIYMFYLHIYIYMVCIYIIHTYKVVHS